MAHVSKESWSATEKVAAWLNVAEEAVPAACYALWWGRQAALFSMLIECGYKEAKADHAGVQFKDGSQWVADSKHLTLG